MISAQLPPGREGGLEIEFSQSCIYNEIPIKILDTRSLGEPPGW